MTQSVATRTVQIKMLTDEYAKVVLNVDGTVDFVELVLLTKPFSFELHNAVLAQFGEDWSDRALELLGDLSIKDALMERIK